MTKRLILGNSQAGCIYQYIKKMGLDDDRNPFDILIIPGGWGPLISISEQKNIILNSNPHSNSLVTRTFPENKKLFNLKDYSHIFIVSLGHLNFGTQKAIVENSIICQGLIHEFKPKTNKFTDRYITKNQFYFILANFFNNWQNGFQSAKLLAENFDGFIGIQKFPHIHESYYTSPDWILGQLYERPQDAHKFFVHSADNFFSKFSQEENITVFDVPDETVVNKTFTRNEFISDADELKYHGNWKYGELLYQSYISF